MPAALKISEIVICDDHHVSALGVELLLRKASAEPLEIRTATSGKMALEFFAQKAPHLAVVDLGLPDIAGLAVIKQLNAMSPACKVIVLTGQSEPHLLQQACLLKVNAVLRKTDTAENLYAALENIRQNSNSVYLDPSVERIFLGSSGEALTRREHEVLQLIASGLPSHEIAKKLDCAVTTIKTYRARIMSKSGSRNSAEMVAWFLKGNGNGDFGSSP
jgi:DNA-binding NarL/FixJ family response regulator